MNSKKKKKKKSVGRAEKGKEKVCALIKLIEEYNI